MNALSKKSALHDLQGSNPHVHMLLSESLSSKL